MDYAKESLKLHYELRGKLEITPRAKVDSKEALSLAYTPGVAEPCKAIAKDPEKVYEHTWKWNTVAVVSDGTRVLGLGDIGPEAAMPVMEGKAMLFKYLGGVDCVPICLDTKDPEKIIETVTNEVETNTENSQAAASLLLAQHYAYMEKRVRLLTWAVVAVAAYLMLKEL